MFKYIFPSLGKIYQYNFSKATVLKRSTKEAMSSSFVKRPTHSLLSYQQRVSKNAMPRQVVPSTDKICLEDFPKAFFKALYKSP